VGNGGGERGVLTLRADTFVKATQEGRTYLIFQTSKERKTQAAWTSLFVTTFMGGVVHRLRGRERKRGGARGMYFLRGRNTRKLSRRGGGEGKRWNFSEV